MFTPQKLWSLTPRSATGQKNGSLPGPGSATNQISPTNGEVLAKGKAVAFHEGDGVMDQESLTERASKLENELFEYQYNMGLLLIEKKEWTLKYEELRQALAEATDTLKREQTAHSSAMYEVEKREENLKKALGVERHCVLDLEKALREIRSEYAEIKFNADSKLAEANALVTSVEEKSLEVEAKFHAADAKLAEVSRKSSEIERKLHELEAQENALRRERSSFTTERDAHDTALSKQREDLREWERKLQEAEERLADSRRLLNQREERANENDKILKEKQNDLEELRKKIEISNSTLKNKEDDISSRLASIALKEKEADDVKKRLEEKEKQLLELEEKLNTREKLEIQKMVDEHKSILTEKQKEFELEMEQKRKEHDDQLKNKLVEVEKKEAEIAHMEEKLKKREQAIEKKSEKVREKELDFDSKLKDFKGREKSLKVEEKNLEKERKQMLAEKEDLLRVKGELENLKADSEKLQLRLNEEREQLKVTEEERTELARLQSELKQEIDKYRFQSEQLMKEADDLKEAKEKFEKEWEELDDKRAEIKKEQEDVLEEKRSLEKLRHSEEERLRNEKMETQQYVQRELEALELAKDSFAASMEHEKSILAEKSQSEKSQLTHDFEMRKQELETEMRRKQEEIETRLHEKEKTFEQEREMELNNINYLREVARREMEEMKLERLRIEKEKLEISQNKKHVEAQQHEMKKDIEELVGLSQKLKDQREQFIKERERFIAFAEKQKNCNICGETIREFMLSDLHTLTELENLEAPPLPRVAENYLKEAVEGAVERFGAESSPGLVNSGSPTAGGTISWLRKCTSKIFKFSPGKKLELDYAQDPMGSSALSEKQVVGSPKTLPSDVSVLSEKQVVGLPKTSPSGEKEPEASLQVANDSFDFQIVESDSAIREVEAGQAQSVDQDPLSVPENSQNSKLKAQRRPGKGGRSRASRTRSVKAAVDGSKTNGNLENSVYTNDDSRAESDLVGTPKNIRKRNHTATVSDNQTEGHSDSIKDGDRPRRRQRVVAAEPNHGQKRYNLRQPKKSVGTVANGSLPRAGRGKEKDTNQLSGAEAIQSENVELGGASREEVNEPGAAAALPRRFGDGDGDEPVRSNWAASEFSADSPFKNAGDTHAGHVETANTYVDDVVGSEVNGIAEGTRDYSHEEFRSESHGEEDDDDNNGGDDDEVDHPGEVSIRKKLWTFLTT
ncbi:protein CROWDED NUCLEI 1 [Sesamum alatum]|uniref:Protein CROWDED NUCLEI 1 n=1 Tax=Sesamum alatum TaxID=300844 RepID=A0AAE1XQW8_9LAMI|nr:protein CROWDED NUCLEI 1 [Sesamum alatum]